MNPSDVKSIHRAYQSIYDMGLSEGLNFFNVPASKIKQNQFKKIVDEFVDFAKSQLKFKVIPDIRFVDDINFSAKYSTFGYTTGKNLIFIDVRERHPMDILRTLAHELVHYTQHEKNIQGDPHAGSDTENEANVKAGILLRNFGSTHSQLFKLKSIR